MMIWGSPMAKIVWMLKTLNRKFNNLETINMQHQVFFPIVMLSNLTGEKIVRCGLSSNDICSNKIDLNELKMAPVMSSNWDEGVSVIKVKNFEQMCSSLIFSNKICSATPPRATSFLRDRYYWETLILVKTPMTGLVLEKQLIWTY